MRSYHRRMQDPQQHRNRVYQDEPVMHQAEMKSQRMIVVFLEKMILMEEIAKERALLIIIKYHLLIQEQIQ